MSSNASVSSSALQKGAEGMNPTAFVAPPVTFYVRRGKRWLDIAFSAVVLLLLSPLFLLLAILIRLTSPGPATYRQKAVGQGGRLFDYYKFRTMYVGSDDTRHREAVRQVVQSREPVGRDAAGRPVYKILNDPRVTPLGRLLRKFSLDELPQFFNVLKGDMSVVGPRPPLPYEAEFYSDTERQRLTVRPGITGLAQVTVRHHLNFDETMSHDFEYIRRQSLLMDLTIMAQTLPALLRGA